MYYTSTAVLGFYVGEEERSTLAYSVQVHLARREPCVGQSSPLTGSRLITDPLYQEKKRKEKPGDDGEERGSCQTWAHGNIFFPFLSGMQALNLMRSSLRDDILRKTLAETTWKESKRIILQWGETRSRLHYKVFRFDDLWKSLLAVSGTELNVLILGTNIMSTSCIKLPRLAGGRAYAMLCFSSCLKTTGNDEILDEHLHKSPPQHRLRVILVHTTCTLVRDMNGCSPILASCYHYLLRVLLLR